MLSPGFHKRAARGLDSNNGKGGGGAGGGGGSRGKDRVGEDGSSSQHACRSPTYTRTTHSFTLNPINPSYARRPWDGGRRRQEGAPHPGRRCRGPLRDRAGVPAVRRAPAGHLGGGESSPLASCRWGLCASPTNHTRTLTLPPTQQVGVDLSELWGKEALLLNLWTIQQHAARLVQR